ncbi:MAG: chemotaxis protein CheX [Actinomycetota bacterium]|nr:chemotaxis protein CheX [Actinomycetota bacterium]
MFLNDEDVAMLVGDVWSSIVGIELAPTGPSEQSTERSLTGMINIEGDWNGTVTVHVSAELALAAAASMFGMEPEETTAAEIEDALGEITNMTGGGIKALVPGLAQLSLPTVVKGADYEIKIPRSHPIKELWFTANQNAVTITVFEGEPSSGATDGAAGGEQAV